MQTRIREFVQGRLGCQCPDKVFESVGRVDNHTAADGTVVRVRINAGNRLLVYVADASGDVEAPWIGNLLRLGRFERDEGGFNRFRLALFTGEHAAVLRELQRIDPLADGAGSSLERVGGLDEKVHAHIIEGDDF